MAEVRVEPELATAIADIWDRLELDDQSVQEPGAQPALRECCTRELGTSWLSIVDAVRAGIDAAPHVAIVRGESARTAPALLAALAASVGEMLNPYRELVPGSPVLQEITPKGPASPDLVWLWHTDSANWPVPNDLSSLACLRAAPSGGATQILSLASVKADPGYNETILAPLWEREISWPKDGFLGGGAFPGRAIGPDGLRFRRELMRGDAEYRDAVELFANLADNCDADVNALLRPGDLVMFDNRKSMHRAGPVIDPHRTRLLLRTKVRRTSC